MPGVNLTKRPVVDLTKDAGRALRRIGFGGFQGNVRLVLDRSGSMQDEYQSGLVQLVLDRVAALAFLLDPDRRLPVTLFHNHAFKAPDLTEANLDGYVRNQLSGFSWGMTEYAPPLKLLLDDTREPGPAALPTIVIFITDGENSDRRETISVVQQISKQSPMLIKFIGLDTNGSAAFPFLEELDNLKSSDVVRDAVDFFRWDSRVSDEKLYDLIFNEIPEGVSAMKKLGLVA